MASSDEINSGDKLVHFVVGSGHGYSPTSTSSCSEESTGDDDDNEDDDDGATIKVGVCAMDKKSRSRPMQEILERLVRFKHIETFLFEEDVILNQPVENWPLCDCLISFHSKGFPLEKAVQYVELRRPFVINDLKAQYDLQDRSKVYQILSYHGIDKPRYAVMNRENAAEGICNFVEADDYIEVNGAVFHKPFVEKPVSAEDHNVYIYFPASAGGGSQRLFRKIGSRSSVYSPISTVRKVGSFMYEEFMPTDGTDVKVYTVGPDYAHAEARKSPALDGKVERDKDGKEIRYPVLLSAKEKLIARTVCLAFKQNVCGFDLLRANGKSYVCDVNGFSFVKTSPKYYDDCAKILGNMILRELAPTLHIPYSITYQAEDVPIVPTTSGTMMELRCVVAVMRHGDRTPKQKMKMEVKHRMFFNLFEKYGGQQAGHLKLKHPKQLQEVLDIARFLLSEAASHSDSDVEEKRSKLEQLKSVLEMHGHFSGINRKVQFKYQPHGCPAQSPLDEDKDDNEQTSKKEKPKKKKKEKSTSSSDSSSRSEPSLVLILKWGGELTPAGKIQAEELGKAFRCMYPGGRVSLLLIPPVLGDYGQSPGLGLLRLHSTFRHDLKIYASDEGRVQMTAAAFAKGFLALEGELTPILVQMVKSANMNGLLDNENQSLEFHSEVKETLQEMMNVDRQFTEEDFEKFVPTKASSVIKAMEFVGNPKESCRKIHEVMDKLVDRIKELKSDPKASDMKLYHGESWELMNRRWGKLVKDFLRPDGDFDISKVPDIYDCIKYDLQHNSKVLRFADTEELHTLAKAMADIVIPQEYGISEEEKLSMGKCICSPLLRKILADFQTNEDGDEPTRLDSRYSEGVTSPQRHVKTRLYFTSESHIHSLLTNLRFGGLCDPKVDEQWSRAMEYVSSVSELNYLSQIVIMLYEDPTKAPNSDERFHVELHFSPGAYCVGQNKEYLAGRGYRPQHGEKKLEADKVQSETNKQIVREVLTSPSQLHIIETVLEEEPPQVSSANSESKPYTRPLSPNRSATQSKQKLSSPAPGPPPLEATVRDRSSRSTIRKVLHCNALVQQDMKEPCASSSSSSSSSEVEDSNNFESRRLKTGRIVIRRSAEKLKTQPQEDGSASGLATKEVEPQSYSSSGVQLTAREAVPIKQGPITIDPARAVSSPETSEGFKGIAPKSGSDDVMCSPANQMSRQSEIVICEHHQHKSEGSHVVSKVVLTTTVEKTIIETIETITVEPSTTTTATTTTEDSSSMSSSIMTSTFKITDFVPDYSLSNYIVQLEKPVPNQARAGSPGRNVAEKTHNVAATHTSTSSSVARHRGLMSPVTSSSPSTENSLYNSCSSSTANSPIKVVNKCVSENKDGLQSMERDQDTSEGRQQGSDVEVPVTERANRVMPSAPLEGGTSRRRHQSTGSVEFFPEGSSVRDRDLIFAANNNGDNYSVNTASKLQQQQQQQQFDFLCMSSFASQSPNLSIETIPPSLDTPNDSFIQSSPSSASIERTAKETRSRSLETLQKKDHQSQREHHHHHHHHHHHREHGRHKKNSFLALFNSPNSESLGTQKILFSVNLISGSTSAPILADVDKVQMIDGWRVPSLRPLETLHNALTLKQVEKFIKSVTETYNKTPDSMQSSCESSFLPRNVSKDESMIDRVSYCSSLEACFKPPVVPPDTKTPSSLSSSSSSQSPVKHSNIDELRLDMSLNV